MTDCVISQLLVLLLLFLVCSRVFWIKGDRRDTFAVLAPLAVLLSVLIFIAWDITFPSFCVFVLSVIVCIENMHSLSRLFHNMVTDYYSPLLVVCSIINLVLIVVVATGIILLRPVPVPLDELRVYEEKSLLEGSVTGGFYPRNGVFHSIDVVISRMVPDHVPAGQLPFVLWVTDPRQTEEQIRPVAARLAARGYEVITADFSKKPVSSALYRWKSVLNGGILPVEDYSMLLMQTIARYRSLLLLYGNSAVDSGRPVFIAGEGLGCEAVVAVAGLLPDIVSGYYTVNGPDSYGNFRQIDGWFDGFGVLTESAPWASWALYGGNPLDSRDATCFYSIAAAIQADFVFKNILGNNGFSGSTSDTVNNFTVAVENFNTGNFVAAIGSSASTGGNPVASR